MKQRIACIGDSNTAGAGVLRRSKHSYPAVLAQLLGNGYEVGNFGVSGACASRDSSWPYHRRGRYKASLVYRPNILLMCLGTNDSKKQHWNSRDYLEGYDALISSYKKSCEPERIILINPPPAHSGMFSIQGPIIDSYIPPITGELATRHECEVIDLPSVLSNSRDCYIFDGIHLNKKGCRIVAENAALRIQRSEETA